MLRLAILATTGSIEEPETVNKSALDTMVTKAAMIDGSIYTQSSWTPFIEALNAATAVIKNEQATNQDVLTAQNNLNAAMEGLDVYAPISTPEVDVEYTFDGTLDATTGDAAAAELTATRFTLELTPPLQHPLPQKKRPSPLVRKKGPRRFSSAPL